MNSCRASHIRAGLDHYYCCQPLPMETKPSVDFASTHPPLSAVYPTISPSPNIKIPITALLVSPHPTPTPTASPPPSTRTLHPTTSLLPRLHYSAPKRRFCVHPSSVVSLLSPHLSLPRYCIPITALSVSPHPTSTPTASPTPHPLHPRCHYSVVIVAHIVVRLREHGGPPGLPHAHVPCGLEGSHRRVRTHPGDRGRASRHGRGRRVDRGGDGRR